MINLDTVLKGVTNPSRYTANEYNANVAAEAEINYCLCFPDVYEVGMSHLGSSILYNIINSRQDARCERCYSPWVDMEEKLREVNIPLFSLETNTPLKEFDILGISVGYELLFSNVINMLNLSGIPLLAKERDDSYPIIIAGGGGVFNIEPICEVFDLVVVGEGEEVTGELLDLYKKFKGDKQAFIAEAAKLAGIYVPSFYDISYKADGRIDTIKPNHEHAQLPVQKRVVEDLDKAVYPTKPLVPYFKSVHDRMVLEIFRGCTRGCRFCQAGYIYRPVREKSLDVLVSQAKELFANTGCDEISLCSLSSGDYSRINELLLTLTEYFSKRHVSVALPSLRVDSISGELTQLIKAVRKTGLTIAPEAGSQRMRDRINKNLTEEDILTNVRSAFLSGYDTVKLYFMLGLPHETNEDLDAIADLVYKIREEYYTLPKEKRARPPHITVSASCFVPKPFTPFIYNGQDDYDTLREKQFYLKDQLKKLKNVKFNYHDPKVSRLEAILTRGDRRLLKAIVCAVAKGVKFDAWNECFDYDIWNEAFVECGIDPSFYANRDFDYDETLPFDMISCGVAKAFFVAEAERAKEGTTTPDCRNGCVGCGMEGCS